MVPARGDASGTTSEPPGDAPNDGNPLPSPASSWEDFFIRTFPRVVAVAHAWTTDRAEAEDAASHAMAGVWQRWRFLTNPEAYAFEAAVRYVITQRRRRRRESPGLEEADMDGCDDQAFTAVLVNDWLEQRLAKMPPAVRAACSAAFLGLSPTDIAAELGCSRAAVYQRLQQSRQRLQAAWERECAEDPRRVALPQPRGERR